MAETAAPAAKATTEDKPGMAYYNKLRADLRECLAKKRKLDKELKETEEAIYNMESAYLEEASAGNIIKGFDNYIKNSASSSVGGGGTATSTRRKGGVSDADRVFSRSSVSFARDSPGPSSDAPPSGAPTPASSLATQSARESNQPTPGGTTNSKATTVKKKKAVEKEEEEEGKPAKRGKITYARE